MLDHELPMVAMELLTLTLDIWVNEGKGNRKPDNKRQLILNCPGHGSMGKWGNGKIRNGMLNAVGRSPQQTGKAGFGVQLSKADEIEERRAKDKRGIRRGLTKHLDLDPSKISNLLGT